MIMVHGLRRILDQKRIDIRGEIGDMKIDFIILTEIKKKRSGVEKIG